ncbi:hypothetical protein L7F22_055046 [Adiantum nelumboides]|nr:hypothetical protein [Adiantum nelumboides]
MATATPAHVVQQSSFADYYFRVTGSNHLTGLKQKFHKLCERSGIRSRHMVITEELLKANPAICENAGKSLDVRQEVACTEIPKLAKETAEKAVAAWGQPMSRLTHLLFFSGSSGDMPGADVKLANMMGLGAGVKRMMFYMQGCATGAGLLRVAKELSESNEEFRLLVLCGDVGTVSTFRSPSGPLDTGTLIGQSFAGDGMAALIVGSSPSQGENILFQIHTCLSHLIPHTETFAYGHLTEAGLTLSLSRDFPHIVADTLSHLLATSVDLKGYLGVQAITPDVLNSCFWAVHSGGRLTLDLVEEKLGLKPDRLKTTREMYAEHGNMGACTVIFALEQVLYQDLQKGRSGPSWGLAVGYGPGISIEVVLLRAVHVA